MSLLEELPEPYKFIKFHKKKYEPISEEERMFELNNDERELTDLSFLKKK